MQELLCGRRKVTITNDTRILFPKSHITKAALVTYYYKIAPYLLPHIKNHPLTLHRFPNGIDEEGFYQKDASDYFPAWIKTKKVPKEDGGSVAYVLCNDQATLVYLANQATITPHIWLSRADKLRYPDRMIFDLDPSGKDFEIVRTMAFKLKDILDQLHLPAYVMTTGSRGVHVVVPLKRTDSFTTVRTCARAIGALLVEQFPDKVTMELRKEKRRGRLFIDVLRNAYGQLVVAPYAVRALEKAPVATPVTWAELASKKIKPQSFTIKNIFKRLAAKGDIWKNMQKSAVSLHYTQRALKKLALSV